MSDSAASGPEQVSTWSWSTVTVQEATQGVPATIRSQRSSTGDHAVVLERQVGLVVHAVQALDDRLLDLVDALGGHAGLGVDAADRVVVDLDLEVLRPAAIAAQPRRAVSVQLAHCTHCGGIVQAVAARASDVAERR